MQSFIPYARLTAILDNAFRPVFSTTFFYHSLENFILRRSKISRAKVHAIPMAIRIRFQKSHQFFFFLLILHFVKIMRINFNLLEYSIYSKRKVFGIICNYNLQSKIIIILNYYYG